MPAPNLETNCLCHSTGRYRRSRSGSMRANAHGKAKQLLEFCGQSLITRAASVALEARCLPVVGGGGGDGRERRGVPGKFARTRCAGSREALQNGRGGCGALLYERLVR